MVLDSQAPALVLSSFTSKHGPAPFCEMYVRSLHTLHSEGWQPSEVRLVLLSGEAEAAGGGSALDGDEASAGTGSANSGGVNVLGGRGGVEGAVAGLEGSD